MHRMEIIELAAFYRPPLYASNQLFHQLFAVLDAVAGMIEIVLISAINSRSVRAYWAVLEEMAALRVWGSSAMV